MKHSSLLLYSFTPLLLSACALLIGCRHATSPVIRLNQVGFSPAQEKTATIDVCSADAAPSEVVILNASGDTVWTGTTSATMLNPVSGKPRQIVDFSDLTTPGDYTLHISHFTSHISLRERPYRELTRKALRAFYYQRASMPIGMWL